MLLQPLDGLPERIKIKLVALLSDSLVHNAIEEKFLI